MSTQRTKRLATQNDPALIRASMYYDYWGHTHELEAEAQGLLDLPRGKPTDRLPPRDDGLDRSHKDKVVIIGVYMSAMDVEFTLVKQRRSGNWGPPHGGLDAGFAIDQLKKIHGQKPQLSIEQAQIAEFHQETGGIIDPEFLAKKCVHFTHDRRYHCVIVHFRNKFPLVPRDAYEITEARWTTAQEAEAFLAGGCFAKHIGECFIQAVKLMMSEIRSDMRGTLSSLENMATNGEAILAAGNALRLQRSAKIEQPHVGATRSPRSQHHRLKNPDITRQGPTLITIAHMSWTNRARDAEIGFARKNADPLTTLPADLKAALPTVNASAQQRAASHSNYRPPTPDQHTYCGPSVGAVASATIFQTSCT